MVNIMTSPLYHKILALLRGSAVEFEHYEHEHVHHSHEAAKVRGTKLEEAAKAIVLAAGKGDGKRIVMCIVSGHRRIDLKTLKSLLGEKNVSLATPEDVLAATGCTIGSVPPFGNLCSPPIPVYADADVFSREHLVFSAGSHNHSVRMRTADWRKVVAPTVVDIGKDVPADSGLGAAQS
jgi:Ala-tRNA(Pro) deacylase